MSINLYRADGSAIEVGSGTYDGIVDFDKLAFGHAYSAEFKSASLWYISESGNSWNGFFLRCKAGDTVYMNFAPDHALDKSIWVLDNYPSGSSYAYNDASVIGGAHQLALYDNDVVEKEYYAGTDRIKWRKFTIPENLTATQAVFVCVVYGMARSSDGKNYVLSTHSFDEVPAYYILNQQENFVMNHNVSMTFQQGMNSNVSRMYGANVLILGDSICMMSAYDSLDKLNSGMTVDSGGLWTCGQGKMYGGYGYYSRIARKYGQTFMTRGRSNARWWTQGGATPSTPYSCVYDVKELCADMSLAHDAFDYIVLAYGTNDILFRPNGYGQLSDVASDANGATTVAAIRYCIEALQEKFDTAAIVDIMPTIMLSSSQANQDAYIELTAQVFKQYGVKCCYPRYEAGITPDMICGDGIHLDYRVGENPDKTDKTSDNNNEGVARYSRCLEAAMLEA